MASEQVPPLDTYKQIEETPSRVIAEVEKTNHPDLFFTTRFLVVKVDNEWKLDDIFWKCTCENGVCYICKGTGFCAFCNGTSRCDLCFESQIPGWKSRTSIFKRIHENESVSKLFE